MKADIMASGFVIADCEFCFVLYFETARVKQLFSTYLLSARHCEERSNLYVGHSMMQDFLAERSLTNLRSMICTVRRLLRSSQRRGGGLVVTFFI